MTATQLNLIWTRGNKTIQERFEEYHAENPRVFECDPNPSGLCMCGYGSHRLHTCNTAQAVVAVSNAARDVSPIHSLRAASSPLAPASTRGAGA